MKPNQITLIGNLVQDAELQVVDGGIDRTKFSIAINEQFSGEESVSFIDVIAFRNLAVNAVKSLKRGTSVVVVGRLIQRSWETPEGQKRSKIEVIADIIAPDLRWATAVIKKNAIKRNDRGEDEITEVPQ